MRPIVFVSLLACLLNANAEGVHFGQGCMSGEVTDSTALLQTRLTTRMDLDADGDMPGAAGVAYFQWSQLEDFSDLQRTESQTATAENDFIVRAKIDGLSPGTRYYYRAVAGASKSSMQTGDTCSFETLPGAESAEQVQFIVGSCMNYSKFMYGKLAKASGPMTATEEDRRLGYPAFKNMDDQHPAFFVGTGDIVYYDNKVRDAKTVDELRECWHEQFRFPRMINFFQDTPTFWSKDDHDFRFNDSDNQSSKLPLPATGIEIFREQLPITVSGDNSTPTYRTHRINRDLQIWLTEGRDYRSPNKMTDGPEKTLWGPEQREWLQRTLLASDAKWKILITPTPMVGPDDAYKKDNHANLGGFRHEADAFFEWLRENDVQNFFTVCGDRHWQYHSIHPSGVEEFACGALNDENSRMGVDPGSPKGTDPEAVIVQPYTSPEPRGGYLFLTCGDTLRFEFYRSDGKKMYEVTKE